MSYTPGDHYFALSFLNIEMRYVVDKLWCTSPIRSDWFEVLDLTGYWSIHYPNGAAVFSSRSILRGGGVPPVTLSHAASVKFVPGVMKFHIHECEVFLPGS